MYGGHCLLNALFNMRPVIEGLGERSVCSKATSSRNKLDRLASKFNMSSHGWRGGAEGLALFSMEQLPGEPTVLQSNVGSRLNSFIGARDPVSSA